MNRQDEEIARTNRLCAGEILPTRGMGVRFDPFRPADSALRNQARRRFRLPEDAFVLLYAAEFSARKNQAELIRALPRLPERVCLLLAGRGAGLEQCRAPSSQQPGGLCRICSRRPGLLLGRRRLRLYQPQRGAPLQPDGGNVLRPPRGGHPGEGPRRPD